LAIFFNIYQGLKYLTQVSHPNPASLLVSVQGYPISFNEHGYPLNAHKTGGSDPDFGMRSNQGLKLGF
jgi:hypothetical protein